MPVTVVVRSASETWGSRPDPPQRRAPGPPRNPPSLTFDGGRVVIGRSDGSDVRLPDPSVSQRHASIRAQDGSFSIVDEGSTNGTWVGGVKLPPHTPRLVRSGDLVRVGRVWLELVIGHKPATPDLGLATRDLALSLVRSAMEAAGDDTVAKVRVVEGPDLGAELRLVDEGRIYLVGRSEKCDLPLADEDASREHASVVRRGGQVLLGDRGSSNGVFLGDARIPPDRDVVWRPQAMARVGGSVLALAEPVSIALAELEAAADEAVSEAEAPPAPPSAAAPSAPSLSPNDGSAPPASRASSAQEAPIAAIEAPRPAPHVPRRRRRVWTSADVLVVTIAVAVIAASIAGLVWVLR